MDRGGNGDMPKVPYHMVYGQAKGYTMKPTCNICGNEYEVTRTVVVQDSILISIKPHEECLEIERREATNPTQS